MLIERTSNEVIIRLPSYVDTEGLQRLVDYLSYKEANPNPKPGNLTWTNLRRKLRKVGGQKTVADLSLKIIVDTPA